MARTAKLTVLLGANGTGKTTLLRQIIQQAGQRALIVTPDSVEWQDIEENTLQSVQNLQFFGIKKHIFSEYKNTLDRLQYLKNCILVFDDCRSYLRANTAEQIHNLLIRRRQKGIDIFAVGHGFSEVPPAFFTFCSDMFLFRTTDNIQRRKAFLQNYDELKKTQERINKRAKTNPYYFEHIKF